MARARHLAALLGDACRAAGLAVQVPGGRHARRACASATATPPTNFAEAKHDRRARCTRAFFHAMLREGVALAPGAYEALFVGLGHTDDVLDEVGEAADRAAAATAAELARA